MKLHVFGDLHFDASRYGWIPELAAGADAVVCTGDVCEGLPEAFAYLRRFIPLEVPIVTVPGNHSFYNRELRTELADGHAAALEFNITLLENEAVEIGGVRFVGATLWTDYALDGEAHRPLAMESARRGLNDHRHITWQKDPWMRFRPIEAAALHAKSLAFFDATLSVAHAGPTVVVSHHGPHPKSIDPKYLTGAYAALNPAYVSDLSGFIERHQPDYWFHGHTHASCDYRLGNTRVINNPHGYSRENALFDPALVIEV